MQNKLSQLFMRPLFLINEPPRRTPAAPRKRERIYPVAMLDVLARKGRSWGLLNQYEEARLAQSTQRS